MTSPMVKFDPGDHPRGRDGRFTDQGNAPSFRLTPITEPSAAPQRRSLTRGESWQRVGAKIAELPVSYTGSRERETPADGFSVFAYRWQRPESMEPIEHATVLRGLKDIIISRREPVTEKAMVTRQKVAVHGIKDKFTLKRRTGALILDPATPRRVVNRAYNHAAMLALHDFGVLDYGPFKMSDSLKGDLTPLVPFMRFVRRSLGQTFNGQPPTKGKWRAYRAAFGQPFADQRRDRVSGQVRLRMRPNQEFVKMESFRAQPLGKGGSRDHAAGRRRAARMQRWKKGTLRAFRGYNTEGGVRRGPVVHNQKQAVAIALRQSGMNKRSAPAGSHDPRIAAMGAHAHRILHHAGRRMSVGVVDPLVLTVLPEMHAMSNTSLIPLAEPARMSRHARNSLVADGRVPLARVLAKADDASGRARDKDGRWVSGAAAHATHGAAGVSTSKASHARAGDLLHQESVLAYRTALSHEKAARAVRDSDPHGGAFHAAKAEALRQRGAAFEAESHAHLGLVGAHPGFAALSKGAEGATIQGGVKPFKQRLTALQLHQERASHAREVEEGSMNRAFGYGSAGAVAGGVLGEAAGGILGGSGGARIGGRIGSAIGGGGGALFGLGAHWKAQKSADSLPLAAPLLKVKHTAAHPGFAAVAARMARRQGIPLKQASAELAASTRRDGAGARKHNFRLKRVKG